MYGSGFNFFRVTDPFEHFTVVMDSLLRKMHKYFLKSTKILYTIFGIGLTFLVIL